MFARDPEFTRPLYRVLLGVNDAVHRRQLMGRSMGYSRTAVDTIPDQTMLSGEIDRGLLAAALQAQLLGLLDPENRASFTDLIHQVQNAGNGLDAQSEPRRPSPAGNQRSVNPRSMLIEQPIR